LYLSILIMDDELINISLKQGKQFNKYQKKIIRNVEKSNRKIGSKNKDKDTYKDKLEGFEMPSNEETYDQDQNKDIFKEREERNTSTIKANQVDATTYNQLQSQYNDLLNKNKETEKTINSSSLVSINRTSANNPYLNKNIRLSDSTSIKDAGFGGYVSEMGYFKPYPDQNTFDFIAGKNGCPKEIIKDVPYNDYSSSLLQGQNMISGQSCGNEGKNVYVSRLTDDSKANYLGCYADNETSRAMTFIGDTPPTKTANASVQNGNFLQPQIANNSYKYITTSSAEVPDWWFNAVIVNNSDAWGFPKPYPNGNQCAAIQKTQSMSQTIYLETGVEYNLSFVSCGRNCCDSSGQSNSINVELYTNNSTLISQIYNFQPPINKWTNYSTTFTVPTSQNYQLFFKGTATTDRSTAIQNISLNATSSASSSNGSYTYEMCKNEAINNGYKYFALQNVNTETNKGYCAVSNDIVSATVNGSSYVVSGSIGLWDTKTNNSGSSASVTDKGTLSVFNSSGASIFNTPVDPTLTSGGYIGCYNDKSSRAMTNTSNGTYVPLDQCKQYAIDGNYAYYGAQNKDGKDNGWCVASNDLTASQKYGVANNCTKNSLGQQMGGGWSNAIYSMDGTGKYFLMLQDDGNMVVYKGTGPNDIQGAIWASKTNGKQQKPNPNFTAAKGKYGQNWMATGSTLAIGDFIGSTDGSIYLLMQNDGNLVLYTSQNAENCQKMKDTWMGGGVNGNALYELTETGVPENLGKVAYIDEETRLREYPSSLLEKSKKYLLLNDFDTAGNDIQQIISSTAENGCIDACNANDECSGFVYQPNGNICYLKNSSMYPVGKKQYYQNSGLIMGIRKPQIKSDVSSSCGRDIVDIDTIRYNNYIKGDPMTSETQCQTTIVPKQDLTLLTDIQNQMVSVGEEMASQSNDLYSTDKSIGKILTTNSKEFKKNVDVYKKNDRKIKNELNLPITLESRDNIEGMNNMNSGTNKNLNMNDINSMLSDTDIRVLQENYGYIFWSILAVGLLTITVSKINK
jgi:hypothetical protein